MTEPSLGTAIAVQVGVKLLERTVPSGLAYVLKWYFGKRVLIVGYAGSGKTTFLNYLLEGVIEDKKDNIDRDKTSEIEQTPTFSIKINNTSTLELNFRNITEIPGQYFPDVHADEAYEREPQGLLMFTDLTKPQSSYDWLERFCSELEDRWRSQENNPIQSIIVVMNKKDEVSSQTVDEWKEKFSALIRNKLTYSRGRLSANKIAVMPCVIVTNPDGTKYVDRVIIQLARDFRKHK